MKMLLLARMLNILNQADLERVTSLLNNHGISVIFCGIKRTLTWKQYSVMPLNNLLHTRTVYILAPKERLSQLCDEPI